VYNEDKETREANQMKHKRTLASKITVKDATTGKVKRIENAGKPWNDKTYTG